MTEGNREDGKSEIFLCVHIFDVPRTIRSSLVVPRHRNSRTGITMKTTEVVFKEPLETSFRERFCKTGTQRFFRATISTTPVSFQMFERSSEAIDSMGSPGRWPSAARMFVESFRSLIILTNSFLTIFF